MTVIVFQSSRSKAAPAELTSVGGSAGDYKYELVMEPLVL